jgi:hypothetical protein
MSNFTVLDTVGAIRAMFGFAAILLCPGYVVGAALDLFGFRRRSLLERLAWAIALSFVVSPIFTVLVGRLIPLTGVAGVFAACAVATLALLILDRRRLSVPVDRETILLGLFLAFGIAVVVGELVDIQRGNRLYLSVTVLDQAYRVAFVNAAAHTGIPPLNPLYHPGVASPMRYYYFWYAVGAVCVKLAHVSARQALIASSVWAGLGLVATIALFARHFIGVRERLHRYILTAALLLTVTGLDILPGFYLLFVDHSFSGDLEWWSSDQISSWMDTILWVPNHTASLLCCLAAFLLLWRTREDGSRAQKIAATVLAGVAAASAFGLSVYVAAGFAILMVGWTATLLIREGDVALAVRNAGAVGTAGVLLIPYLRELMRGHSGTEQGAAAGPGHLLQFSVRAMIDPELIAGLPVLARLNGDHPVLLDQMTRLILLLPGYVLELGAFGMVLVLTIAARKRLDLAGRTALGLALGGLVLVSFVRSSVIGNNDFGYRAALLPCFFLLLLTAQRLTSAQPKMQGQLLGLLLTMGVLGTAFQALMLRIYVPLHVAAHMPDFEGLPEAAFAARRGYAAAVNAMPATAIVQSNLGDPGDYGYVINMLFSERAMATDAAVDCGAVFGGDPGACLQTQQIVQSLFTMPAPSASEARAHCRTLGAGYLSVARSDPAWEDTNGWVWTLPLATGAVGGSVNRGAGTETDSTPGFRVVNCALADASMP